ncbi:MAG TPA: hypothetical protein GXZ86_07390 [Clostridiales bacterium]|jgi:hypothetical protein|nr:hypothetical protein [Clostridiales bacterium]
MTPNPHRQAGKLIKRYLPQTIGYTLLTLLARLIALAPLVLTLGGYRPIEPPIVSIIVGFVLTCFLYLLVVAPLRMTYRRFFATAANSDKVQMQLSWTKTVNLQIKRTLRTFLYHLPFIFALFVFFYYTKIADAVTFLNFFRSVGQTVIQQISSVMLASKIESFRNIGQTFAQTSGLAPELIISTSVVICTLLISALISYFGVMRHIFLDMLPLSTNKPFKEAKRLKKQNKSALKQAKWGNFWLSLPFTLVTLYFLGTYIVSRLTGKTIDDLLTIALVFLNLDFSATALYGVLGAFVLLYLPLYPLRKVALSCAAVE